ncbi:hypothetical protein ACSBR2_033116 [Camellia fascicularis]
MSKDQVHQQNLPGDGEPNQLPNDCEECQTPTSLDHKIPTIQTCPPAPRKHGLEFSRKRKFPKLQFFEIKGREEIESFFGSSFEFSGVASRSVKKKTIQSVKFTYHTNNVLYANCALYLFEKGGPLPKFGEWDVNDPASAEGFTVIFNKARNEKKTGGKPESPTKEETAFNSWKASVCKLWLALLLTCPLCFETRMLSIYMAEICGTPSHFKEG